MKNLFTSTLLFGAAIFAMPTFAQGSLDDFKKNREYYLIYMDDDVVEDNLKANAQNEIKADLRVNDTEKFLYIWDGTYADNGASGANFYGGFNGYLDLKVGTAGWSGAGFALSKAINPNYYIDFTKLTADHKFHMALKSTAKNSHLFFLWGGANLNGAVCIGSEAFVDNGVSNAPVAEFTRDGKWHSVEIPISTFMDKGFRAPEPFNDGNYFSFLSGGTSGNVISMDAIFIYKDLTGNSLGETDADANNLQAIVTDNVVSFVGANAPVQIYNIAGNHIATLDEPIIGVDELSSGVYIAKAGTATAKFIIK